MGNHLYKRILALGCLCFLCGQLTAQVNAGTMAKNNAVRRDYAWYLADFKNRFPDAPVPAVPANYNSGNRQQPQNHTSYKALQQRFVQQNPGLQQHLPSLPVAKPAKVNMQSYKWCMQNMLPAVQHMYKPDSSGHQ